MAPTKVSLARTARAPARGPAVPSSDRLDRALHALAQTFSRMSGIGSSCRVTGSPRPLPEATQGALIAFVGEALSVVERPSRATGVAIHVTYRADRVVVRLRDDGVGMAQRATLGFPPSDDLGLRRAARALADAGGRLALHEARPRGVEIVASVAAS